jgi:hypothetical protein
MVMKGNKINYYFKPEWGSGSLSPLHNYPFALLKRVLGGKVFYIDEESLATQHPFLLKY